MQRFDYTGQMLDERYLVEKLLGAGGFGAVYAGKHRVVGKRVAIKFLHADFAGDEQIVKRFYREAQAAAAIDHRNIIDVFDVGISHRREPYIVMEFLEGESLADLLQRVGRLDLGPTLAIVEPVLQALEAAHSKGIVHRDLKPDNIFLVYSENAPPLVKLIDFGISKFNISTGVSAITQTGSVLGTPAYMSPEQARGDKNTDHRTDIYAIGVILYEMLTGKMPFRGDSYNELLIHILTEPHIPPSLSNPDFPTEAEGMIAGCLTKAAASRIPDARTLLNECRKLSRSHSRNEQFWAQTAMKNSCAVGDLGAPDSVGDGSNPVAQDVLNEILPDPIPLIHPIEKKTQKAYLANRVISVTAIVAVVFAGVLGVQLFWRQQSPDTSHKPSEPVEASPSPSAADITAPASAEIFTPATKSSGIEIVVSNVPGDASILYNDVKVPMNPFRVEKKDTLSTLKVVATGYAAFATSFVPNRDLEIKVEMTKLSKETSGKKSVKSTSTQSAASLQETVSSPKKISKSALDDLLGGSNTHDAQGKESSDSSKKNAAPSKLTRQQVMSGMSAVAPSVQACGDGAGGTFKVRALIGANGVVKEAVEVGSFQGTPAGRCASDAVMRARFPQTDGDIYVTYPFKI